MFNFNNLVQKANLQSIKKFFAPRESSAPQEEETIVKCVEFNDYPVFEIDGKQYRVELENSRLTADVESFLNTLEAGEEGPEFVINEKRTYPIPSLDKYLSLIVSVACELADDEHYVITHLGIEKAVLPSNVFGMIEPETVEEF